MPIKCPSKCTYLLENVALKHTRIRSFKMHVKMLLQKHLKKKWNFLRTYKCSSKPQNAASKRTWKPGSKRTWKCSLASKSPVTIVFEKEFYVSLNAVQNLKNAASKCTWRRVFKTHVKMRRLKHLFCWQKWRSVKNWVSKGWFLLLHQLAATF